MCINTSPENINKKQKHLHKQRAMLCLPLKQASMVIIMIKFDEEQQNKKLGELRLAEQENLARLLSERHAVPYQDLSSTSINTDALRLVKEERAREAKVAPFQISGKNVSLAVVSPEKESTKEVVEELKKAGYSPSLYVASEKGLERAWGRYKEVSLSKKTEAGVLDIGSEQIALYKEKVGGLDDFLALLQETLESKDRYQTTSLLELLIAGTLATNASDIHFEPKEDDVKIRLRLDGVLTDLVSTDHKTYTLLNSRVKLLSGLLINVRDIAQDGRFSIRFGDLEIEIRTSVVPGAYGESIVLRVLNPDAISVPLEELGIRKQLLDLLLHEIHKPNGMILNTGPTGSGKTTTLYAFLKKLSTPQIKIITIENPIEYHLPNITQTQTDEKSGYTFLQGLRSALRQDPDVIMVGEIRDPETAKTAINASLTGHYVLSTLHTNNAAGAIPRLIDLEVNPKIIGSSLSAVIAQRLVRRLCAKCKKEVSPSAEEKEALARIVNSIPENEKQEITTIFKPEGCAECNNTGYKGRVGIYEVVMVDEKIEKIATENPSERGIRAIAAEQGFLDMRQDGILKVLEGITTLEEISRVVDMDEEVLGSS
jgi:type IV pilus assembly protein PilB